jgi:hypothetical protein
MMSHVTSDAQSTNQQSSFFHEPPIKYTTENHHEFMHGFNMGFVCTQQDTKGSKGISSTRYVSIVSNADIDAMPVIEAILKESGKQVVEVNLDGDLEAEWSKMDIKRDGRFRETIRDIWEYAQQSVRGPLRRWEFDNGTDHEKLLENPSVRIWTVRPRPTGQHFKSSTRGIKTAPSFPRDPVAVRKKHYVESNSRRSQRAMNTAPSLSPGPVAVREKHYAESDSDGSERAMKRGTRPSRRGSTTRDSGRV